MRPAEVLDFQADLADRAASPMFQGIVKGTLTAESRFADAEHGLDVSVASRALPDTTGTQISRILPRIARAAEAYHVSADMSVLVQHVASQLDDLDRFDLEAVPTPQGIVRFDEPLPIRDLRGKKMLIHWMVWSRMADQDGRPMLLVYMFNDWHEPDDIGVDLIEKFGWDRLREIHGPWGFIGCETTFHEQRMGPAYREPDPDTRARVIASGDTPHAFTNSARYVHALFLLLNQTVVKTRREDVPRPFARRARRARIPARVTVVALRRTEYVGEGIGETSVEWSHRWLVRAHLRWQPCGPDYPGAVEVSPGVWRARIVILPYVKGPADKPLVVTNKVYDFRR